MNQGPRYMLQRLVPKYRYNKVTEPEKYGSGPIGFLKNAWGEVSCFPFPPPPNEFWINYSRFTLPRDMYLSTCVVPEF
jgi:hypothetical protein